MTATDGTPAPRVTRDVDVSGVQDLLEHPPRATVAFVHREAIDLLPARAHCSAGVHSFGLALEGAPDLDNREVVLVIDDGPYWFELRGISVRGMASRMPPPEGGASTPLTWYVIQPGRVLAWDYGAIREE